MEYKKSQIIYPIAYIFFAFALIVMGFAEGKPVYLIASSFVYLIALVWISKIISQIKKSV